MGKFEVIYQVNDIASKHYMQIFRFNGKCFKIYIEHTTGKPCGFNNKCCLSIMLPDGTFAHLVDNVTLQVKLENQYFCEKIDKCQNQRAEKAFKYYVEKVYS